MDISTQSTLGGGNAAKRQSAADGCRYLEPDVSDTGRRPSERVTNGEGRADRLKGINGQRESDTSRILRRYRGESPNDGRWTGARGGCSLSANGPTARPQGEGEK